MSLEEFYKKIRKNGFLIALIVDREKFEEIWGYRKNVYSVYVNKELDKIIEIKPLGVSK
jgi:hypothetical protein